LYYSGITYKNPIGTDVIKNLRDPFILLENGKYYLTGTLPPYWDGTSEGVKLWSSDDLLHWKEEGFLLHRSIADEHAWFRDYWWAPEIHKKNGKFYLTVNCRNDERGIGQNPLLAVSDRIGGGYQLLNAAAPFFTQKKYDEGLCPCINGNDANLFTDVDGKTYLSVCSGKGIYCFEIDLDTATLLGDAVTLVEASENGWDTKNEGQFLLKHDDTYYCFYSSFTRSYEVGVATAKSIKGPWIKDERNPLITPLGVEGLHHSGHNCIFADKNENLWTAYHVTLDANRETQFLAIDPLSFDEEGRVVTPAPTLW